MDALAITAVISGLSGLAIAVFSHVKHSECSRCFVIDTRTPQPSISALSQNPYIPKKQLVVKEPDASVEEIKEDTI